MSSRPFAWQLFQNCGATEGKVVLLKSIQVYQTFCLELKLETRADPVSVLNLCLSFNNKHSPRKMHRTRKNSIHLWANYC